MTTQEAIISTLLAVCEDLQERVTRLELDAELRKITKEQQS